MRAGIRSALIVATVLSVTESATIYVNPGDNLDSRIESAKGGDIVLVRPGTYGKIQLSGRNFSAQSHLVVRKDPGASGTVLIKGPGNSVYEFGIQVKNCSHIYFEGFEIKSWFTGIWTESSHHIVMDNMYVHDCGQEGTKIKDGSEHIDYLNLKITDTGNHNSQWGEGIYVGTGSGGPDVCRYIWIEGCTISETGNGEAINIKGQCFYVTVHNNTVSNIHPGANGQMNGGAIAFDDWFHWPYQTSTLRDHWVTDNTVRDVYGGTRNNGLWVNGLGVKVTGNTITSCGDHGIYTENWGDAPGATMPIWIYDNNISGCGDGDIRDDSAIRDVYYTDPGTNPRSRQTWYLSQDPPPPPPPPTYPRILSVSSQQAGYGAAHLLDSNLGDESRWSAEGFPQHVVVDYGEEIEFRECRVHTYQDRAYRYTIEASDAPSSGFYTIVDRSTNSQTGQPIVDQFSSTVSARYVRLTVAGADGYTGSWVSIRELEMVEGSVPSVASHPRADRAGHPDGLLRVTPLPGNRVELFLHGASRVRMEVLSASGRRVSTFSRHRSGGTQVISLPESGRGVQVLSVTITPDDEAVAPYTLTTTMHRY